MSKHEVILNICQDITKEQEIFQLKAVTENNFQLLKLSVIENQKSGLRYSLENIFSEILNIVIQSLIIVLSIMIAFIPSHIQEISVENIFCVAVFLAILKMTEKLINMKIDDISIRYLRELTFETYCEIQQVNQKEATHITNN